MTKRWWGSNIQIAQNEDLWDDFFVIEFVQIFQILLWPIVGLFGMIVLVIIIFALLPRMSGKGEVEPGDKAKPIYRYILKKSFMTPSEHAFYDVLGQAVGRDYRIFAQVHLPTIVNHMVPGQSWKPAFSHINGKSVDFVLCDKENLTTVLAIELDDPSHEQADRVERDIEVERILDEAGVPLLRIADGKSETIESIASQVSEASRRT